MALSEIVSVTISKETSSVARAGFGVMNIVGPNVNVNGRIEFFTDPTSALAKLVGSSTLEAAQINAAFAQNPTPERIALGAIESVKIATFVGTMTDGSLNATVNGVEVDAPFDLVDLPGTISDLAVLIDAQPGVLSAIAGGLVLTVTPDPGAVIGITYDVSDAVGTGIAVTQTSAIGGETYAQALAAIEIVDNNWYGSVIASRVIADQNSAATYTETKKKVFCAGSADSNIVDQSVAADTTSIAALTKNASIERTFVLYGANAATEGNDAAFMEKLLPQDPGTYTAKFKTLALITVDNLTPTQSTNARNKFANTLETIGGKNIIREGTVAANEFIDVIIFIDWLESEIKSAVFSTLVNALKIPYTDLGITAIQSSMEQPLQTGENRGGISPEAFDSDKNQIGGFFTTVPKLADVPTVDKTGRVLNNVKFVAFLAGAIHKVVITGIVTV